jgi:hypothetical protein
MVLVLPLMFTFLQNRGTCKTYSLPAGSQDFGAWESICHSSQNDTASMGVSNAFSLGLSILSVFA